MLWVAVRGCAQSHLKPTKSFVARPAVEGHIIIHSVTSSYIVSHHHTQGSLNQEELRIIKIFRFVKVARMIRFLKVLKKWENSSSSKTVRTALRISKFLSFMLYDDVTLCMMMWHCVWWCDTVYDDVALCMMMWHCVCWCDTMYDDVTLCMMMWHCEWWCDTVSLSMMM